MIVHPRPRLVGSRFARKLDEYHFEEVGDAGRIPVRVNPANGYRLFRREDLESFLKDTAKPTVKEEGETVML